MASNDDQIRLLEELRWKLEEKITVEQVLNRLYFIEAAKKEEIQQRLKNDGDITAARLLIDTILKGEHPEGWFRCFVDALEHSGCGLAADYLDQKVLDPEVEAENDYYVRLVFFLIDGFKNMDTVEVCEACYAKELITADDQEQILAEVRNKGNRSGAGILLRRIVRGRPGWFSTFLQVLHDTDHAPLVELATGIPVDEQDDKPLKMLKSAAGSESVESMEVTVTGEPEESTDLYQSAEQLHSMETSTTAETDLAAAVGDPENAENEIELRNYQMEVAKPALEGKNIMICLPTGSGKTRVAVYITKKHLDIGKAEGETRKVVVLVNKIPLVEQHYAKEFLPFLKPKYKVERVSGDSQLKISFAKTVDRNDVIICTAQILENYLERANGGEDDGVKLKDLSLIVIDECHHTQKGGVYNHIMLRYLKQKHKNKRLIKEQKKPMPLPQILGLTASPGVGKATKMDKAEEHIMRICANLDASRIMSLGTFKKEPRKTILTVEGRKKDPFGDVIKNIMNAIHQHAELSPTCELGSQNYEQWVVQKERQAAKEDQMVRVCADYLRHYNDSLLLSNTIRMCDALNYLNKYHEEQMKKKTGPDEDEPIQITKTERFLLNLFKEHKVELEKLSKNPEYENDSLSKLRVTILREFSNRQEARGIIFTKTRNSAILLNQWIQENPKFSDIGVKPSYVIGAGDQSDVKPMTGTEQKDVLKKFGLGQINLLIATTVAEEGLDIPACNFVIRYGLVTNEIAMIQSQGRGRAEDSTYIVVDIKNSGVAEKECVNEHREGMMIKAIEKIKGLKQADYDKRIIEFQIQAIMEDRVRQSKQNQKAFKDEKPEDVKFSCRHCSKPVCSGENIQIIENMHRVNVSPEFKKLFIVRENVALLDRLLDYEVNGLISCKGCGQPWGSMMMYRGIECPCLNVKNFVVEIGEKKYSNFTRWSDLPIKFPAFDYIEHASQMEGMEDDEDE